MNPPWGSSVVWSDARSHPCAARRKSSPARPVSHALPAHVLNFQRSPNRSWPKKWATKFKLCRRPFLGFLEVSAMSRLLKVHLLKKLGHLLRHTNRFGFSPHTVPIHANRCSDPHPSRFNCCHPAVLAAKKSATGGSPPAATGFLFQPYLLSACKPV